MMDVVTSAEHTSSTDLAKPETCQRAAEEEVMCVGEESICHCQEDEEMASKLGPAHDASTTCPECLKPLRLPRLLECLHTMCEDCMRNRLQPVDGTIDCPVCHRSTKLPPAGFAVLPLNWVMNARQRRQFSENATSGGIMPLCEDCIMDEECPAVSMCIECRIFLCSVHSRAHKRSRQTRAHCLIEKEEELTVADIESEYSAASVMCGVHPHRPILGFCLDCNHTYCMNCLKLSHSDHKVLEMEESCTHSCQALKEQHANVTEKLIPEFSVAIQEIDHTLDNLEDRSQELSCQITQWVQKRITQLRDFERQLLEAVSDLREQKEEPLSKQRAVLTDVLSKARHATDLSGSVINLENGAEVLDMYVSVENELKSLMSRQSETEVLDLKDCDFMQYVPNQELENCLSAGVGFIRGYPASPGNSEIVGLENQVVDCKKDVCVSVQLRNDSGEPYVQGCDEDSLKVAVVCPNRHEVQCAVRHFRKGLHKVVFKPEMCGIYSLTAVLHGTSIHNSPYQVSVPMRLRVVEHSKNLVALSADRRTAELVKIGDSTILGDIVFNEGCHTWTVCASNLSLVSELVVVLGVIALPCDGVDCAMYRTWSWRSDGLRVAGGPSLSRSCFSPWLDGDEFMLELNCTAGTLCFTQLRTGAHDTIHGVRPPLRPFFFMQDAGHQIQILSP